MLVLRVIFIGMSGKKEEEEASHPLYQKKRRILSEDKTTGLWVKNGHIKNLKFQFPIFSRRWSMRDERGGEQRQFSHEKPRNGAQ